jgi:DNA polymerase-3 subunit gamma/tau
VMVLAVGAEGELLAATPRQRPLLQAIVERWPLDTVLAALQILSEARGRLRGSPHARLIVELALVRVARLEDMAELGELITRLSALEGGTAPAPGSLSSAPSSKKKPGTPESAADGPRGDGAASPTGTAAATLDLESVRQIWPQLLKDLKGHGIALSEVAPTAVASPNVLVIALGAGYNWVADLCEKPEARSRIEEGLRRLLHRPVTLRFDRAAEGAGTPSSTPAKAPRRRHQMEEDPLVQKVVELFEARPVHLEVEDDLPGPSEP